MEENKEKKTIKVGLSTFLFIIALIVICVMAFFIYKFYDDKTKANNEVNDLKNQVNTLQNTVNSLSGKNNAVVNNTSVSDNSSTKQVKKIDNDKEIVYTYYNKISSEYSYSLPYVNIDSEYANKINDEISKRKDEIEEILGKTSNPGFYATKYKSFINNNVLSLVIWKEFDGGTLSYTAYNMDIYTGKEITNKDLINSKNVSEATYLNALKESYKNKYLELYGTKEEWINRISRDNTTEEQKNREAEEYQNMYNYTVADKNISIESPIYLNGNGKLCNIATIYSLAGASRYSHEIELDF